MCHSNSLVASAVAYMHNALGLVHDSCDDDDELSLTSYDLDSYYGWKSLICSKLNANVESNSNRCYSGYD